VKEQRSQRAKFSTRGDHPPGRCYVSGNYVDITLLSRGYYHCHVASGAGCPDPVHLVLIYICHLQFGKHPMAVAQYTQTIHRVI
jgi:hypothetical protein